MAEFKKGYCRGIVHMLNNVTAKKSAKLPWIALQILVSIFFINGEAFCLTDGDRFL
jgi:hypothetical protein